MKLERILVIGDCHHPYVDNRAWELMLRARDAFKPHRTIQMGDFGDFHCTNRHSKDPNRARNLEYEIGKCNAALDQLDDTSSSRHMTMGNHEWNCTRYLQDKAPELFNMIKVDELFRFRERGWTWTKYGELHKVGRIFYTHDQNYAGQDAHLRTLQKAGHSVVIGHTHHLAVQYKGTSLGERRVCAMSGWLGDVEAADYAKRCDRTPWQHGFLTGLMLPNGVTHLQAHPIVKGQVLVDGKVIELPKRSSSKLVARRAA